MEAKVQSASDIMAALPFPRSDLEEIADLEPGTLIGAIDLKPEPVLKAEFRTDEAPNVVSIFRDKQH